MGNILSDHKAPIEHFQLKANGDLTVKIDGEPPVLLGNLRGPRGPPGPVGPPGPAESTEPTPVEEDTEFGTFYKKYDNSDSDSGKLHAKDLSISSDEEKGATADKIPSPPHSESEKVLDHSESEKGSQNSLEFDDKSNAAVPPPNPFEDPSPHSSDNEKSPSISADEHENVSANPDGSDKGYDEKGEIEEIEDPSPHSSDNEKSPSISADEHENVSANPDGSDKGYDEKGEIEEIEDSDTVKPRVDFDSPIILKPSGSMPTMKPDPKRRFKPASWRF